MLPYFLLPCTSSLMTQMERPCPSLPSTHPEAAAPAAFEVGNPGEDQFLPFKDSHTAQKRGPWRPTLPLVELSSPLFYFTEKAPPLSYCTAKATLLHLVGTMTFPEAPGLPRWCRDKESACNVGDLGSIPGLGRSPGEGNGNWLWYSCLENPMDRGAWRTIVHGVAESDTTEHTFAHT